jgi:hypothetical protein
MELQIREVLGARCISQNMGNESSIVPTQEPTTIKLAKYGIVDHRSFGCKMYITEHGE